MKKIITLLTLIMLCSLTYSQSIIRGEYFFDTDPGIGAATSFTFGSVADSVETNLNISVNGLSMGLHVLYLRTLNDSGSWSFTEPRMFNIINQAANTSIASAEYFFDSDPGIGLGNTLNTNAVADSVEFNPQISAGSLSTGLHVLYIRTKNTDGIWGLSEPRMVNVVPNSNPNNPISSAEYFFDTDPGVGLANSIAVNTVADSVEFVPSIPTSGLSAGLHVLYLRTKNTSGVWSLSEPRMVNVIENIVNSNIVAGEYFIDTDPGVGLAIPFNTGAPADSIEVQGNYPLGNLSLGDHYIYMRTKNTSGVWSLSEGRLITAFPCVPIANINNPSDTVAFCSGNPVSLSADTTGAYGYLWSTGDTTQTIQLVTGGVITLEVFDAFGCSALDTIYSNLGVSPAFTNCADITVIADSGQCGALVDYGTLGLTGNPFPITSFTQNSNTFFPVGITNVTATAINNCSTETCVFSVVVVDAQLPSITAPAALNLSLSGSNCSISNPNLGSPNTNDNCGNFTVSNNAPSQFYAGTTIVTWTIDDGNGNTATANQTVNLSGNVNFGLAVNAASTTLTTAPLQAVFTNSTPNLSNYNFVWYFGDGTMLSSNAASVNHTYYYNGVYTISLVATENTIGCSDTLILTNYITCDLSGGLQCNHTVTTNPSGVVNACIGSIVPIASSTNAFNPSFQWNRNGAIIGGASQSSYDVTQAGNYTVTVFDTSGCPMSSSVIQVNYNLPSSVAPTITGVGNPGPCGNVNMVLTANGSFSNYLWNTGQTGSSITVTQGGSFTVIGQSPNCDAVSIPFDIIGSNAPVPPICMVTVDESDNKNVIIWEKPVTTQIDSFVVLREDINNPGVYTQIHSQDYVTLSEFKDINSFANERAYRYKLAVIDTCSGFTIPSNSQRSMHLNVAQGNNVLARQLNWNVYQGQPQAYTHYLIFRETAPGNLNLALIDSVPSSQTWYYDNSLTNILDTARAYMVGYRITTPCVSSRATNQICQSNVTSNERPVVDGVKSMSDQPIDWSIVPNPNNGKFVIHLTANTNSQIRVYNLIGEELFHQQINGKQIFLNLSDLSNGVYIISLEDEKNIQTKRLVLTK